MRVLIIEDHPVFTGALIGVVKSVDQRLQIDTAVSVAEALARLERPNDYRLITLDLAMPGLDGLAFLRILSQRKISAPVCVVSASEDVQVMHTCIADGAKGFIPKSYRMEKMSAAIRAVLTGETYLPEVATANAPHPGDNEQRLARCAELSLTKKHFQVLRCMADGKTNKEIAAQLFISVHTVKAHNARLFEALNTSNRTDTVVEAMRLGLIDQ